MTPGAAAPAGAQTDTDSAAKPSTDSKPGEHKPGEQPAEKPAAPKPGDASPVGEQPAVDPKTTDDATADAVRKAAEAEALAKAPVKYALTIPDSPHIDDADRAEVETLARANAWTNEDAQAELDYRATAMKVASAKFLEQTTGDPDYGGAHFEETQRHVEAALNRLRPKGTPRGDALRGLMNKTGLGNHIALVSLLADVGKLMAEDTPPSGGADGRPARDAAAVLYPDMAKS